jgi:hypothetical protein
MFTNLRLPRLKLYLLNCLEYSGKKNIYFQIFLIFGIKIWQKYISYIWRGAANAWFAPLPLKPL